MIKNYSLLACVLFLTCSIVSSRAQTQDDLLILDLGSISPGKSTVLGEKENRTYHGIRLLNIIPNEEYTIEIEREIIPLDPLKFEFPVSDMSFQQICPEMTEKMELLKQMTIKGDPTEKEIKKERENLLALIPTCSDSSAVTYAKLIVLSFETDKDEDVEVRTGEKITITVRRNDKWWKFVLRGKPQGEWVTTYGFSFLFLDLGKKNFVSQPIDDSDKYTIEEKNNRSAGDLEYIPAIFLSYFPLYSSSQVLNHSLTGGLGFDGASPVVMLGYSLIYRHNIGFSTGLAFHQQQGLKGEYRENQVISSDLSFDQLHDPVYRPNLFFSVQFRLGKNPFKEEKDLQDPQ